jgi:hypothetical protein
MPGSTAPMSAGWNAVSKIRPSEFSTRLRKLLMSGSSSSSSCQVQTSRHQNRYVAAGVRSVRSTLVLLQQRSST